MSFQQYMKRAIELAEMGSSHVSPNPMVGCVIVHDNNIIGEGYHYHFGGAHAEIVAINSVKDRSLLKNSTLFVTLEPCSHYGKTPPCADTIVNLKIPRVVISCFDPNPLVAGKGIQKMKNAGVDVQTGILEKEYRFLNRRFFTFFEKKRPYIILKWAQSQDGFIDYERTCDKPEIHWISSAFNKTLVHKWRSEEMGILVGANTIINDNPQLTNRLWSGNNPIRIVLQSENNLPTKAHIFDNQSPTLIFSTTSKTKDYPNTEFIYINNSANLLNEVLNQLYNRKILSIIVEGGQKTLQQFIEKGLWNEARVLTGNVLFKKGVRTPEFNVHAKYEENIGDNLLQTFFNNIG